MTTGQEQDLPSSVTSEAARRPALSARRRRAPHARYRVLFETLTQGIVYQDASGHITATNRAAARILGLTPAQLQGRTSLDPHWRAVREDGSDFPGDQHPAMVALRTGRAVRDVVMGIYHAEQDVYRWINVSAEPLFAPGAGRPHEVYTLFDDITERRQLEHRTRDALAMLLEMAQALVLPTDGHDGVPARPITRRLVELTRRVLGCARAGIWAVDPTTGALQPIDAVGLSPEQERHWYAALRGVHPRAVLADPARAARLRADGAIVLLGAELGEVTAPFAIATLLVAPFGSAVEARGFLALDHGALPHAYTADELALAHGVATLIGFVLEREQLLRAQAETVALRATQQRMDAFLRLASHELRSPLTSIRGAVQLVRRRLRALAAEETQHAPSLPDRLAPLLDLLERADVQTGRMNRIVGDLLDVSRIDTGYLELQSAAVDLTALVRATVQEVVEWHPARTITLDLPDCAIQLQLDADRIAQVVTNYLTNALKYSPVDRPVRVALSLDASHAWVHVRDEGPGLTPEQQARVWERYGRIDGVAVQDPATQGGGGLGLGLHISRTLIECHGGTVHLESTLGAGSVFSFALPLPR